MIQNATNANLIWLSWSFFFLFRIQSEAPEDIFAYKGNDSLYQSLYEACQNEVVCFCRNGETHECNTPEAIRRCSPPEQNGPIPPSKNNHVLFNI
jgi:hypothetical protein